MAPGLWKLAPGYVASVLAAFFLVLVLQQYHPRRAVLVQCSSEGCFETDRANVHPSHTDIVSALTGRQSHDHISGSMPAPVKARSTSVEDVHRQGKLKAAGVNVEGSDKVYKSIPTAFWDKSEFDFDTKRAPRTAAQAQGVRQKSLAGEHKLQSKGVLVTSKHFFSSNRKPTPAVDGMIHFDDASKPCSRVYVAAIGGMEAEPYLGTISQKEKNSRLILERAGVKVGGTEHVHSSFRGPCLAGK